MIDPINLNGKKPVLANGKIVWVEDPEALPEEEVIEFLSRVYGAMLLSWSHRRKSTNDRRRDVR